MHIEAVKFPYRYMEYEKEFTVNEIAALIPNATIKDSGSKIDIYNINKDQISKLNRLTYIQYINVDNEKLYTQQALLEMENGNNHNRQHTRYSTHGIHEYKGKFNPQVVRYFMNYFNISGTQKVLDPFNGSGTTTLECAHMGISATGTDINPMACFIANAKVESLKMDVKTAREILIDIENALTEKTKIEKDDPRTEYLIHWIPSETLSILECIKNTLKKYESCYQTFYLMIASDLIRDYSNQEPKDLRIRKRYSPYPDKPIFTAFKENANKLLNKIEYTQSILQNKIYFSNVAINCDIRCDIPKENEIYDVAITSPPYATALPYIDTQRLSLVWLGLCPPNELSELEASLIGSRELLNQEKQNWKDHIETNSFNLPENIYNLILQMKASISKSDGFRKQAVPTLLYRYFSDMKLMFKNVFSLIKVGGKFALIVGKNKTTLGEKEFLIDTPGLLGTVAEQNGWNIVSITELQTYKRYGINSKNAINNESLIILERMH